MRAMVTGANGFVGRYLLGELSEAGYDLLAVDLASSGEVDSGEFPADTVYKRCDLRDAVLVNELLEEWEPGNIFHLAARSSAAKSFHDPAGTFQANLIGTLNLLEADRRLGLKAKIMLTGSSEEVCSAGCDRTAAHWAFEDGALSSETTTSVRMERMTPVPT